MGQRQKGVQAFMGNQVTTFIRGSESGSVLLSAPFRDISGNDFLGQKSDLLWPTLSSLLEPYIGASEGVIVSGW